MCQGLAVPPTILHHLFIQMLHMCSRMNLWKRKIIVVENEKKCVLCSGGLETVDHLIFCCSESVLLWKFVYRWAGYEVVMPEGGIAHYLFHRGFFRGKGMKQQWMVIWFSTIWTIWLARNGVIFNQEPFDVIHLLDLVKFRAWNWFQFRGKGSKYCYSDWCISPVVCMLSCCVIHVWGYYAIWSDSAVLVR